MEDLIRDVVAHALHNVFAFAFLIFARTFGFCELFRLPRPSTVQLIGLVILSGVFR